MAAWAESRDLADAVQIADAAEEGDCSVIRAETADEHSFMKRLFGARSDGSGRVSVRSDTS